jgi:hypothetical protein
MLADLRRGHQDRVARRRSGRASPALREDSAYFGHLNAGSRWPATSAPAIRDLIQQMVPASTSSSRISVPV